MQARAGAGGRPYGLTSGALPFLLGLGSIAPCCVAYAPSALVSIRSLCAYLPGSPLCSDTPKTSQKMAQVEGVAGYFSAADVPGSNDLGAVVRDEEVKT